MNRLLAWLVRKDKQLNAFLGGTREHTVSYRLGRYIESSKRPLRAWLARAFCRTILLPLALLLGQGWKHCRKTEK